MRPLLSSATVFALLGAGASALHAQQREPNAAHAHMALTTPQPGTAADSARALAVVDRLRTAIAPYQTLEAAEAAGYQARREPESIKTGRLLHVGRIPKRGRTPQPFDASKPQALLYRREADGTMRLAGAMFVAPPTATAADLDTMIPLSVGRWHRHVNVCVSIRDGTIRPMPRITTPEACDAASGRFRAESRYMIHVMTDAGNDLAAAFPQGHDMEAMRMEGEHDH